MDVSAFLDKPLLADVDVHIVVGGSDAVDRDTARARDLEDADVPAAASGSGRRAAPNRGGGGAAKRARTASVTLPGHRVVLHSASPVFAAQIERWGASQGLAE